MRTTYVYDRGSDRMVEKPAEDYVAAPGVLRHGVSRTPDMTFRSPYKPPRDAVGRALKTNIEKWKGRNGVGLFE